MTMKSTALILIAAGMPAMSVAEIVRYPGTAEAIPHDKYVRVVSEADRPSNALTSSRKMVCTSQPRSVSRKGAARFPQSSCFTARPVDAASSNSSAGRAATTAVRCGSAFCRRASWWSSQTIAAAI